MGSDRIRVGFIGLNPDSHWAATAHLPALQSLADDFEITGVANSTAESAQRTAKVLGLSHAFESPAKLVTSDAIDLVVVTVKVPNHLELVTAALEAGKHVHCEWPLANGWEEAQKLAELAKKKRVVATIGTQMRASPEVRYLQRLVADGYVGEVLSTTLIGDGGNWGAEAIAEHAYLYDRANGATMLTIPFGHTLAGVMDVLGEIEEVNGRLIQRRRSVRLTDTNQSIPSSAADQIMVHGVLASGAAFSAHYRGGMSRGTNFLWEINGTEGDIQVTGNIGHGQFAQLTIRGGQGEVKALGLLTPPPEYYRGLPSEVVPRNVAGIYALIANDIREGSHAAPSFDDALRLHRLLDQIADAS